MKTAMDLAPEVAGAQTEEQTESILQKELSLLREELKAEIQGVADATQKLTLRADAHESHWKEVTCLTEEIIQHIEVLRSPKISLVTKQVHAMEAEHKQTLGTIDMLRGHCNEQFEQLRSDLQSFVTCNEQFAVSINDKLAKIKEQMYVQNSDVDDVLVKTSATDMQDSLSTHEDSPQHKEILSSQEAGERHDDQTSNLSIEVSQKKSERTNLANWHDGLISNVHTQLSQVTSECTSEQEQLSEILCQVRAISTNLRELRNHGATTKERVDKNIAELFSEIDDVDERISDLNLTVSQLQGEQEAKQLSRIREEEHMADQLGEMRGAVEVVLRDGFQAAMAELVKRSDLDALKEATVGYIDEKTTVLYSNLATKGYVDEKTSMLYSNLSHIKLIAESALIELNKQKAAHKDSAEDCLPELTDGSADGQILEEENTSSADLGERISAI